jgi:hypothetical protein
VSLCCRSWLTGKSKICSVYVGYLLVPSWNTDQGVLYYRESKGLTKPHGVINVKVDFGWLWCDLVSGLLHLPRATSTRLKVFASGRSLSDTVETRKMVNYACAGWSQRKLWWRIAAVLTCKSIVGHEYRGERLIEPSSSWFPPKFPSG